MSRETGRETIDAIVADPMVQIMMRADAMDPEVQKGLLLSVRNFLSPNKPT